MAIALSFPYDVFLPHRHLPAPQPPARESSNLQWKMDLALAPKPPTRDTPAMTQKELVIDAINELPDDASLDQIADRVEFLAAIQKGFDQLDRGEGIPHEDIKRQLASWLTS